MVFDVLHWNETNDSEFWSNSIVLFIQSKMWKEAGKKTMLKHFLKILAIKLLSELNEKVE